MTVPQSVRSVVVRLQPPPELSRHLAELQVLRSWHEEIARPRHADPKRLLRCGFKVYSQNDEDGIIQEIFRRIGVAHRTFVEFGVQTGVQCNTARLLVDGWSGLWIEADSAAAAEIRRDFAPFMRAGTLALQHSVVTAETIEVLIERGGMRGEVDVLSIDIDYNDYWVWKAIEGIDPRVVIIEYNATLRPPMSMVVPYRSDGRWDGSNFYGASLEALVRLGKAKGYRLVGCSIAGVNAFFVRADLCGDRFLEPATAEEHYEPPRYYFHLLPAGHRSRPGVYVSV